MRADRRDGTLVATATTLNDAFEAGTREEREAVVRWLRSLAPQALTEAYAQAFVSLAQSIEAGEHRKEADCG